MKKQSSYQIDRWKLAVVNCKYDFECARRIQQNLKKSQHFFKINLFFYCMYVT